MPPWISHISAAQRKESRIDSYRFVQLATIGTDNTPRVRTVVFRGWSQSYEMELYTDKRSQKYYELDLNNNVEICWYFSRAKYQFRFRGNSRVDIGKDNLLHWERLSERSKSMWSWPTPGDKYLLDQKIDLSNNNKGVISNNFTLLKIDIKFVDLLILVNPIHIRRRWTLKKDWIEERINP